jgi:hypothetical protein
LYVDGVEQARGDASGLAGVDLNSTGVFRAPANTSLTGSVDSVHVWTSSLTAMEVGKLYAEESPKFKVAER